jgi:hypothetical protein
MLDWSKDEAEEDASTYMLNPRKKRSEQTMPAAASGANTKHEDS